jgi:hypothetical protein
MAASPSVSRREPKSKPGPQFSVLQAIRRTWTELRRRIGQRSEARGRALRRAVIAGCARDCGTYLPSVLDNIGRIASLFSQAAYVFVENDSADSTKSQLAAWGAARSRFHLICLDGLAAAFPVRTVRIEVARNRYLEFIRESELRDYDYLVLLDFDNANVLPLESAQVVRAIDFLESDATFAAGFANQENTYCDMWALRHPTLCPGDVWEEVLDYAVAHSVPDELAYQQTLHKRIFSIAATDAPIEVLSAFGGLGIYKMKYALQARYRGNKRKTLYQEAQELRVGWEVCEHVHFNQMVRWQGGRLFILPWLINRIAPEGGRFPSSAYRSLLFPLG